MAGFTGDRVRRPKPTAAGAGKVRFATRAFGLETQETELLLPAAASQDEADSQGPDRPGGVRRKEGHQGCHEKTPAEPEGRPGDPPLAASLGQLDDGRARFVTEEDESALDSKL
jgi:hypothetical protein